MTPMLSWQHATHSVSWHDHYRDSAGFRMPSDQVASSLPVASDLTSM